MNAVNELLESIKADLLSRRLLPMLVALSIALAAAVVYAATGAGSTSVPAPSSTTPTSPGGSPASAVPLSVAPANPHEAVAETPSGARFQRKAPERDPFTPLVSAAAAKAASGGTSTSTKGGRSSSGAGAKTGGSSPGSGATGGSTTGTGTTPAPATKPAAKVAPKPKHVGLTPKQSYRVALSLTSQGGNLDAIESLQRLSGLPSEQQPLLLYLGVLEGGHDALFVVQPGTVVSGPGGCTPGPTDCEILSLAPNQIESLAVSAGGGASNVALFAVTAVKVDNHPTVTAADRARREAAAYGRALLQNSTLPALALFEYQPAVGAVVDLRDLAVGGEK